jgi:hypothetical protein
MVNGRVIFLMAIKAHHVTGFRNFFKIPCPPRASGRSHATHHHRLHVRVSAPFKNFPKLVNKRVINLILQVDMTTNVGIPSISLQPP